MKCPYNNQECSCVDTSGMTLLENCTDCEYYNNGVRATGSMPVLEYFINLIKKLYDKTSRSNQGGKA